ncbi:Major sperm protein [Cynara cardunculus var. scolymus]|uniref:Major sperm protein n=1 Tax=Cynara cardunculus var. scolymus TaxID=59895 RepID=A0A118JTG3_CYNCS|nr:Major sperm protein [Cynara cardunculus var. scolymus]
MPIVDDRPPSDGGGGGGGGSSSSKVWGLLKLPFRSSGNSTPHTTTLSSSYQIEGSNAQRKSENHSSSSSSSSSSSVLSVARSLIPTRRRLRLDPRNKLYFPYEPGKQVQSAIKIKNTSKSHVAFKFQTTAPKSCFMRPPGAILAPGESIIATVFKFVEAPDNNEKPTDRKRKVKFKIMSLKVKGVMDYVPELALEKLKRQLAEAEAALETRKKPPEDTGPKIVGDGLVIDEWVSF